MSDQLILGEFVILTNLAWSEIRSFTVLVYASLSSLYPRVLIYQLICSGFVDNNRNYSPLNIITSLQYVTSLHIFKFVVCCSLPFNHCAMLFSLCKNSKQKPSYYGFNFIVNFNVMQLF